MRTTSRFDRNKSITIANYISKDDDFALHQAYLCASVNVCAPMKLCRNSTRLPKQSTSREKMLKLDSPGAKG